MGLAVERPDVNESRRGLHRRRRRRRTGDEGRSASGSARSRASARARSRSISRPRAPASGPFQSLFDFCQRVDAQQGQPQVLEALVKCGRVRRPGGGAEISRARIFAAIDAAIERAAATQRDKESGQPLAGAVRRRCGGQRTASPRQVQRRQRTSTAGAGHAGRRSARAGVADDTTPRPTSGCPRRCSPTRRRAWAFTSAGTRSIASPTRSAASPTPPRRTAWTRACAPRSCWRGSSSTSRNGP